ncbi:hypothetical protein FSBG_00388 [Fusobacterium gonidiaformans 3-1-5R]|uniref:Uncharacterized protein n=1 Tax=Fusobacterium gonidiaformans 3-1-5R TaxID=469605 RepID=E5BFL0_9FUSO|nr:hypothetical protein [Fusobacterium gonidiaformans]EFS20891.1 hypothetical protein FSBG_00388 [Fusobacterium gonidiaformans 3-1-5R]
MSEELKEKKNPLEKIADMTLEMAKLVLVTQSLSTIKDKETGKEQGFAEMGDEKLSNILKVDKSRIGGKNGIIYEAVMKGYIFSANVKTDTPVLDKEGNVKLSKSGEPIMKSHRILAQSMEGLRKGFRHYGVEIPEKLQVKEKNIENTKTPDFKVKESNGLSR